MSAFAEAARLDASFTAARAHVASPSSTVARASGVQRVLSLTTQALNQPAGAQASEAADAALSASLSVPVVITVRVSPMRRLIAIAASLAASSAASAQVNLLPSTAWGFAPIVSGWHFTTPLATSAGAVGDAAQAAVPFQVRVAAGAWSFDVTGAYATGAVHLTSASSSGGNGGFGNASDGDPATCSCSLNGPTDMKVRMSGPLVGDRLLLVAGVNLPTGTTRLNADQLNVLQTISAPGARDAGSRVWHGNGRNARPHRRRGDGRLDARAGRVAGKAYGIHADRVGRFELAAAAIRASHRAWRRISPSARIGSWARRG